MKQPAPAPNPQRCETCTKNNDCDFDWATSSRKDKYLQDRKFWRRQFSLLQGCASHTPATPSIEAWAIKGPDGKIRIDCPITNSMTNTVVEFTDGNRDWKKRYAEGYRCVRVRITEMEAEK